MSFYPFYNKIIAEKGLFVHPGTVCDILTSFLRIYVGQIVASSRSGGYAACVLGVLSGAVASGAGTADWGASSFTH